MKNDGYESYASIALERSVYKLYDYGIPCSLSKSVTIGTRVEVPLQGGRSEGYVIKLKQECSYPSIKPIYSVKNPDESLPEDLMQLALWMSRYYCTPLGIIVKKMLPVGVRKGIHLKQQLYVMRAKSREELKKLCIELRAKYPMQAEVLDHMLQIKKGILLSELLELTGGTRSPVDSLAKKKLLKLDSVRSDQSPLVEAEFFHTKPKDLNEEQAFALESIKKSLQTSQFQTHLLYGVTGSGKTEVYLQAIDEALSQGKSCLMLVPEISLTPQTVERFRSRFDHQLAVLHHRLSHGERYEEWKRTYRGEAKILIGARSAVFAPFPNLGLIIVDEEHEHSYKQNEEMPCYHARDVAVMRGRFSSCSVILGSATPSLESFKNAHEGKYILHVLSKRPDQGSLPTISVVDMKVEFQKQKGFTNFSGLLLKNIQKRFEIGEQTILFLNRRGYHTSLICQDCGKSLKCRHCDLALSFHKSNHQLICHLCSYTLPSIPQECPKCRSSNQMKFQGVGTEQVEKSLNTIFPEIRTLRMDADTTKHKGSHERLYRDFATGKADVLIGTQMIAKGLHFPQVTLVGVLNSDAALNIPDYRSSENVFQLITQVSGRAGRGVSKGEVIIQTVMPDNMTIQISATQNYSRFYEEESRNRDAFGFPPTSRLAKVLFSGADEKKTETFAQSFRNKLIPLLPPSCQIYPILPPAYAKVKDKYRFQCIIIGEQTYPICDALSQVQRTTPSPRDIKVLLDINPISIYF